MNDDPSHHPDQVELDNSKQTSFDSGQKGDTESAPETKLWLFLREHRKRFIEFGWAAMVALILVGLSRLETRLLDLSKTLSTHQDFFTSIVFFGQINFNVILILVLAGLVFRGIVRLIVEQRRGVIGSNLRAKLVLSFIFFAGAPTVLMFYISYRFITDSFDTWFSSRVQETIQQTREAGARVYQQDQRRMESLAQIALQKVLVASGERQYPGDLPIIDASRLRGFETEYKLNEVKIFDRNGRLRWRNSQDLNQVVGDLDAFNLLEASEQSSIMVAIESFLEDPALIQRGMVENEDERDIVRGIAPLYFNDGIDTNLPEIRKIHRVEFVGIVVVEEHFEAQILKSIESILNEFSGLRPGAQLIRISYIVLLVAMLFLILFAATWLGFYVARVMTVPIQTLALGAQQVAHGNYAVTLPDVGDDDIGQLIHQFNAMTKDLRRHKSAAEESETKLIAMNRELERRRKYMEVVLNNINTGVISIDSQSKITSMSQAAKRMLQVHEASDPIGLNIEIGLGTEIFAKFWQPIAERMAGRSSYSGQAEVVFSHRHLNLLVEANRLGDNQQIELGMVVVFDDATERVKAQRVAAWREVARRIAHEIKNPITPIQLNSQRLLRRFAGRFEGEDRSIFEGCIESILVQVESLRTMVNEFSKFARMPSTETSLENLNDLLRETVNLFAVGYPEIYFDFSGLAEELPPVAIDRQHFSRAVVNLLTNSIDAMQQSKVRAKEIQLSTQVKLRDSTVEVRIQDNGPGFSPAIIDRVVEPYVSTKRQGTGLGLAIVNQMVAEHGGRLKLKNSRRGGATVTMEFPIQRHPKYALGKTESSV